MPLTCYTKKRNDNSKYVTCKGEKDGVKKPTVKKKPNKFALLAEKRLAAKKKKLVTSVPDKRMPFLSTRPLDNVKGFLGVNPGKSTVDKRKQILISKLDKLGLRDLKKWLSTSYSTRITKGGKVATGEYLRTRTYAYIMKNPISSTALDNVNKFITSNKQKKIKATETRKQTIKDDKIQRDIYRGPMSSWPVNSLFD